MYRKLFIYFATCLSLSLSLSLSLCRSHCFHLYICLSFAHSFSLSLPFSKSNMFLLMQVTETDSNWEEGHFQLANYFYTWSKAISGSLRHSIMPHIIKHYGESLKYGNYNIFQSLPRLLTTWFELEGDHFFINIMLMRCRCNIRCWMYFFSCGS